MKLKLATTSIEIGTVLAPMAMAADSDTDRNKPTTFVKDSVITTKIKSKLAAESPGTMTRIKVDTDKDGVVWMSGEAKTQAEAQKAADIAKGTEGVKSVKSDIKIQPM